MKFFLLIFTCTLLLLHSSTLIFAQDDTDYLGVIPPSDSQYSSLTTIRPSHLASSAISLLLGGSGIAAFVYLLWGGTQWVLSGGDKEGIDRARKKITSALIGLSVVFSSYALLFIVQAMFGIQLVKLDFQYIENTIYPTPLPPVATNTPIPPTNTPIPPTATPATPPTECTIGDTKLGAIPGTTYQCLEGMGSDRCNGNLFSYNWWCVISPINCVNELNSECPFY